MATNLPHVAVAIPAYNEAEGIDEFLREIDVALAPSVSLLDIIVVDDASTDATADTVRALVPALTGRLTLVAKERNEGHGPTVMEAYRRALATGGEMILQVDGDGQFLGSDLRRLLVLLEDGARAVCGVRRFRQDPVLRMVMTRLVRVYVSVGFGLPTRDSNCPLRGYHRDVLENLLADIPSGAMVPNLYLTVLAAGRGVPLVEVDVTHRVRRGVSATGSTWVGRRRVILWRLLKFSTRALRESVQFRRTTKGSRNED